MRLPPFFLLSFARIQLQFLKLGLETKQSRWAEETRCLLNVFIEIKIISSLRDCFALPSASWRRHSSQWQYKWCKCENLIINYKTIARALAKIKFFKSRLSTYGALINFTFIFSFSGLIILQLIFFVIQIDLLIYTPSDPRVSAISALAFSLPNLYLFHNNSSQISKRS